MSKNFFNSVALAPPDPILGLNQAFASDPRAQKVNLGVGAYKTEDLQPLVLQAVSKAEQLLVGMNKEYLPIEGHSEFLTHSLSLVLGDDCPRQRIFAAQALGGTGALRVAGQFLMEHVGKKIFIPSPTWDNHARVFSRSGLEVASYRYYDETQRGIDFLGLCKAIKKMPQGSTIVLHGCCHNPTGCDPTFEQWKELCEVIKASSILPFFDFAYQGFGEGLEIDAAPIRYFVSQNVECLIAASFSKNFGLYGERTGALFVVCENDQAAQKVGSQIKVVIRGIYSNPPSHGARIIATILQNVELRELWKKELTSMRLRIKEMRKALVGMLTASGDESFLAMEHQKGMFAFTGLSSEAVDILKRDYGIYLPRDGRISLAGLNRKNLPSVVDAIFAVKKKMSK